MTNEILRKKYRNDGEYKVARNTRNRIKRGVLPRGILDRTPIFVIHPKTGNKIKIGIKTNVLCTVESFVLSI